jgi:hypothetical protein
MAATRTSKQHWAARHNRIGGNCAMALKCVQAISLSPTVTDRARALADRIELDLYSLKDLLVTRAPEPGVYPPHEKSGIEGQ